MNKTQLPYHQTGYFSKLITDYLEEKAALKPFYNHYCAIDSFAKIIEERKQNPINRAVLIEALSQQYPNVETSQETKTNIQRLNNDNCFTVTTGHQLNLFTGPLYFIYKIVSAINLAKELKANYPENDFVPVYWMATEDHDFEEVNHFNLLKKRYSLTNSKKGAVGQMKLEGVEELLSELKTDLGDRARAEEILELFSKYYSSAKTYAEDIKGIVNHLFGKYGLVIIDGDDEKLKRLFVDEFIRELTTQKNHTLINQTSQKLKDLGFKPQVTPRKINLFYLQEGLRERIVFEDNYYKVLNTDVEFSEAEILEELNNHPERFSPNVVMRPLYQEKILPNLAYIGGGGELAYWFQLKQIFNANNISFPILVLRNSVLFIDKGSSKRISKLGLAPTDLFKETDTLIKEYLKKGAKIVLDLRKEEQEVVAIFEDIVNKAGTIDQSLQPFVKAELQKNIKSLKNIESRLIKAEKQKEEVAVNQIKNLKDKLFPNGSLQERHDNLTSLLLFYGEGVVDDLVDHLQPLDKEFVILTAE
jgi:bacillithiol biosynthesis cysteine-adding enzyme BshC